MTHARQQIRAAAATLLAATPTTWGTVCQTRIPPSRPKKDFLMVFSDGESSEKTTADTPANYGRRCNLAVIGHLQLPGNTNRETIEDKMDAMAAEIETKLTFVTLEAALSQVLGVELLSTEMTVIVNESDEPDHAELSMSFVVDYFTVEGAPTTLI